MKTDILPAYNTVADIQPEAGPASVRIELSDGTLLEISRMCGPSDYNVAYANLFAAAIDMHARLIECQQMLLSVACQPSDNLPEVLRNSMIKQAISCNSALRKAVGEES